MKLTTLTSALAVALITTSCCHPCYGRRVRTGFDITPGHCCQVLDWRYGAADIRIQVCNVARFLMDGWFNRTGYDLCNGKPRIIITEVDNRTDQYVCLDMMRDVFENIAVEDGRFTVVVGDARDAAELDYLLNQTTEDAKYNASTQPEPCQVTAPRFLGKVRLTKAINSDRCYDYEEYRLTVTLYDIQTQEIVDSAFDILRKQVQR